MQKILERKATTYGGRNGLVKDTQSGLKAQLAKPVEMGGVVNSNTNPEELFSMGYSSCFASSLEYLLQSSQTPYTDIKVMLLHHLFQMVVKVLSLMWSLMRKSWA
jgi:organic hydroperoxide reductase OsmC/OhrA